MILHCVSGSVAQRLDFPFVRLNTLSKHRICGSCALLLKVFKRELIDCSGRSLTCLEDEFYVDPRFLHKTTRWVLFNIYPAYRSRAKFLRMLRSFAVSNSVCAISYACGTLKRRFVCWSSGEKEHLQLHLNDNQRHRAQINGDLFKGWRGAVRLCLKRNVTSS